MSAPQNQVRPANPQEQPTFVYVCVYDYDENSRTGHFLLFTKRSECYFRHFTAPKDRQGQVLCPEIIPADHGAGLHALPGGKIESRRGEQPGTAALREWEEETGMALGRAQPLPPGVRARSTYSTTRAPASQKFWDTGKNVGFVAYYIRVASVTELCNKFMSEVRPDMLAAVDAVKKKQPIARIDFGSAPADNELDSCEVRDITDDQLVNSLNRQHIDWFHHILVHLRDRVLRIPRPAPAAPVIGRPAPQPPRTN